MEKDKLTKEEKIGFAIAIFLGVILSVISLIIFIGVTILLRGYIV